jgi:hypothetical protein
MGQLLLFQHLWYAVAIILPVFVHMQAHVGLYRGMVQATLTVGLVSTLSVLCHPAWVSHCFMRIFAILTVLFHMQAHGGRYRGITQATLMSGCCSFSPDLPLSMG